MKGSESSAPSRQRTSAVLVARFARVFTARRGIASIERGSGWRRELPSGTVDTRAAYRVTGIALVVIVAVLFCGCSVGVLPTPVRHLGFDSEAELASLETVPGQRLDKSLISIATLPHPPRGLHLLRIEGSKDELPRLIGMPGERLANLAILAHVCPIDGAGRSRIGYAWRVIDSSNYYIGLIDFKSNELEVAVVKDGHRRVIGELSIDAGSGWRPLSVGMKDDMIEFYCVESQILRITDRSLSGPGNFGLCIDSEGAVGVCDVDILKY